MRRLLWLVCIAALVAGGALAATPEALIKDGSALAPLRAVAEWLGAELVGFDQNTSTIHIVVGEKSVALIIGQTTATVNKVAVTMPAAPILREGVSYVPLRFVGEVFGATVAWDGAAGTVTVVNPATGEKLVMSMPHLRRIPRRAPRRCW
jgi:hypothetical protein